MIIATSQAKSIANESHLEVVSASFKQRFQQATGGDKRDIPTPIPEYSPPTLN